MLSFFLNLYENSAHMISHSSRLLKYRRKAGSLTSSSPQLICYQCGLKGAFDRQRLFLLKRYNCSVIGIIDIFHYIIRLKDIDKSLYLIIILMSFLDRYHVHVCSSCLGIL